MTPAALLGDVRAAGGELLVVGGRLAGKHIPPNLAPLVKAHAAELRALLASAAPPVPVDRQVEGAPPDYLDRIELDGLRVLGPIRGRALAAPSAAVDPGRAAAWRQAYRRRLDAGLDPESAERLTCTTHGPRPEAA